MWFAQGSAINWAITLGQVTFYSCPKEQVTDPWHKHEDYHKRQWKQYWYIGFAVLYLYELWQNGYWNNRFEVEARRESLK